MPLDPAGGVALAEAFVEPRAAAQDCGFARDDFGTRAPAGGHERGGQIAAADVFRECAHDDLGDVVGQLDHLTSRNSKSAFCTCRRFSASSQTTLCGPSSTSA